MAVYFTYPPPPSSGFRPASLARRLHSRFYKWLELGFFLFGYVEIGHPTDTAHAIGTSNIGGTVTISGNAP